MAAKFLGQFLLERGTITSAQLLAALDAQRASMQHRDLQRAISAVLPTVCFAGDPATPDAVFPNNVFGTAAGRYILGRMRHEVRQREAARAEGVGRQRACVDAPAQARPDAAGPLHALPDGVRSRRLRALRRPAPLRRH